jgi:CPA1 family monovalent cation:H+ antiporter
MPPAQVIEFLLILLIAASLIAMVANRFRIPYTIALVIGGFAINFFHIPKQTFLGQRPGSSAHFLTPDVVFILVLPALLFEAGINLNLRQLRANVTPILFLAVCGVITAMIITGYTVHWVLGLPLLSAMIFGSLISATDPVSVLALLKNLGVSKRLSILIEGESLFNDGTAIVLFQILLATVASGGIHVVDGIRQFIVGRSTIPVSRSL